MNMDKVIKVTIGLAEPMRGGDTIRFLLMCQRSRKIYNEIQKSFKVASGLYPPEWSYLGGKALEAPDKDVIRFLITNKGSSYRRRIL
jgi:hypothetical protein